jgi:hypothetical protein
MSPEMKLAVAAGSFGLVIVLLFVYWRLPKRLKASKFSLKWKHLQDYLKDSTKWPEAILMADKMLDEALKKRKFKGGSMGERMVSAQRYFSNNDDIWFAHNLCKKLKANNDLKLKEDDVKDALVGFRQALRDLGALDNGQSRDA